MSAPSRTERSTCEYCLRTVVRPAGARGWRHVPAGGPCLDPDAQPVRPGSALRALLLALLAAGVCEVALYEDGFEIGGGAEDTSLLFVNGVFTAEQVASLLGVPIDAIDDQRAAQPNRPGDDPHYTRHGLTVLGDATAWRYPASRDVPGDHSDHFWLAALGVEVMIRHRDDGIYVSVANEAIDPEHGPLLVEVNESGATQYGDDHRDELDGAA